MIFNAITFFLIVALSWYQLIKHIPIQTKSVIQHRRSYGDFHWGKPFLISFKEIGLSYIAYLINAIYTPWIFLKYLAHINGAIQLIGIWSYLIWRFYNEYRYPSLKVMTDEDHMIALLQGHQTIDI